MNKIKLINKNAEIYIPNGISIEDAIPITTHMGIAAHQDDLEMNFFPGILESFQNEDKWFTGVIVTNGAGSARSGLYAEYTDQDMQRIRRAEQKKAAVVGEYTAVAMLDYNSADVNDSANENVISDIEILLQTARPQIVYTHNPADKHDTHVSVALRTIQAIRRMQMDTRPNAVYGFEAWRDLDWMADEYKQIFDVSAHENLAVALNGIFDSQISGGKKYDLAIMGRRRLNATMQDSHGIDKSNLAMVAMDLTPLIKNDSLNITEYVLAYVERLANDISSMIRRLE